MGELIRIKLEKISLMKDGGESLKKVKEIN